MGNENATFVAGILLCLAFNAILHGFYGMGGRGQIELFIYTGNFTFLVLVLAGSYCLTKNLLVRSAWGLLIVLTGANNILVWKRVLEMYE